jgi:hypothetical protein
MTRNITFAGPLEFGDVTLAGTDTEGRSLVAIERKPRGEILAERVRDLLPDDQRHLVDGYVAAVPPNALDMWGPAIRSARLCAQVRVPWSNELAGMSIADIAARIQFSDLLADFEPGSDLEAWSLPLVTFTFDFLATPADLVPATLAS